MKNKTIVLSLIMIFLTLSFSGCGQKKQQIKSIDDFNQSSMILGTSMGAASQIKAFEIFPDAKKMDFANIPDGCAAVKAGKIDGYAFDSIILNYYAENDPSCIVMDESYGEADICAAFKKGNTDLRSQMNSMLMDLAADGTLESIQERWLGDGEKKMPELEKPKKTSGTLRILTDGLNEPFSYMGSDGTYIGLDLEVGIRFAYYLGMDYTITAMPFNSLIAALQSGKGDLLLAEVNRTDEREKSIDFSEPYAKSEMGILVQRDRYASADGSGASKTNWLSSMKSNIQKTFVQENRWKMILEGLGITVLISVLAFIIGSLWGALLCLMSCSSKKLWSVLSNGYVRIITGIPILVWIMILYYIVFQKVDISGILVAILGFGLEQGAQLSGLFKTGIDSVDKGQLEAASAMGFRPVKIFRKIMLPQAANHVFDLYKGQFVALVKATSIVGYIAIMDLTKVSDIIRSRTYEAFFPLIATALIYYLITYVFLVLLTMVEHKIDPTRRKRVIKGVKLHD